MASERELGMSQLIEAMTPNKHRWHTQAARLLANHLAFDIIYLPSWVVVSGTPITFGAGPALSEEQKPPKLKIRI